MPFLALSTGNFSEMSPLTIHTAIGRFAQKRKTKDAIWSGLKVDYRQVVFSVEPRGWQLSLG